MLKKDSTGSYEYTPDERELINKYIGEQQMFRQLERIIKNPRYQKEIEQLKLYRQNNSDFSEELSLIQISAPTTRRGISVWRG